MRTARKDSPVLSLDLPIVEIPSSGEAPRPPISERVMRRVRSRVPGALTGEAPPCEAPGCDPPETPAEIMRSDTNCAELLELALDDLDEDLLDDSPSSRHTAAPSKELVALIALERVSALKYHAPVGFKPEEISSLTRMDYRSIIQAGAAAQERVTANVASDPRSEE